MLDLRRLRLLSELHARGTIAAVADALQYTPSAVSQQLALLEREAGVRLLERAGRGVRLTDPALVLVEHADALLERTSLAEADLAAAAGTVTGRGRIAGFQSVLLRIALPAVEALAREAPRLRCEFIEAEPEQALPALALGDVDLVLGDEWQHQPWRLSSALQRHELLRDPVHLVLPARHPAARRHRDAVPLAELAG
jgi:DNA-binding transcriptional LysR family regulator